MAQSTEPVYLSHALPLVERTIDYLSGPDGRWVRHRELIRVLQSNPDVAALLSERAGEDEAGTSVEWFAGNLVAWFSHDWTTGRRRADSLDRDNVSGGYVYRAKRGARPPLPKGFAGEDRLPPPAYSEAMDTAMRFAAIVHGPDHRKGTKIPYVMHPMHVARILEQHWYPERVVIAGLLHDALEDPNYSSAALQHALASTFAEFHDLPAGSADAAVLTRVEQFMKQLGEGHAAPGVLDLVEHASELKRDVRGEKRPWMVRKQEQVSALATAHPDALAVKAADALHNLRSMSRDLRDHGTPVMQRFNAAAGDGLWYNAMVSAGIADRLGETHRLAHELVEALFEFDGTLRATGAIPDIGKDPWSVSVRPPSNFEVSWPAFDLLGDHGRRIHARGHWFHAAPPAKGLAHWKDGRSAKELARAWTRGPLQTPRMPSELTELFETSDLLRDFQCAHVRVEWKTPLPDGQRGPRNHDLVAYGMAGDERVVVCVEAKADEPFGPLIDDVLKQADETNTKAAAGEGPATGRRTRVEALCRLVFGRDVDDRITALRYQLLHAVAGTVLEARASGAERACFVVHEFTGAATEPERVRDNGADLDAFVHALGLPLEQCVVPGTMHGPFAMSVPEGGTVELLIGKCRTAVS